MAKKAVIDGFGAETVPLDELQPHPRNYRIHTEDQLNHLMESLKEHGYYRNVVIARDGTILAGHGVVQAAKKMGLKTLPVKRLDVDPNDRRALKVLMGDNEIAHLAEVDDRILTDMLSEIMQEDPMDLLGTGYDDMMLANLLMVSRTSAEIAGFDEAAEWIGLPEYDPGMRKKQLVLSFDDEKTREEFVEALKIKPKRTKHIWYCRWPDPGARRDISAIRFDKK